MQRSPIAVVIVAAIAVTYLLNLTVLDDARADVKVGVPLLGAGLVLIGSGLYTRFQRRRFLRSAGRATGTVVDIVVKRARKGNARFPVIRFTGPAGEPVEFHSSFAGPPSTFTIGAQVPVRYDPAEPRRAEVDSFLALWFMTLMLLGLGAVFAAIGAVILLLALL